MEGEVLEYMSPCLKTCSFLDQWESRDKVKWKINYFKTNFISY